MAIASDFRYAVRLLFRNPRFSVVAIAAIALGIGANAAIFSVVNAVLLQPLPYADAARLVRVCRDFNGSPQCATSIPKYLTWARARSFDALAAYDSAGPGLNLSGGDRPQQVRGIHVSASYFRVFEVSPLAGRTFTADEDRPGGPNVAVLSYPLWSTHFGRDAAIAGRTISLNGDPYVVVGVLPQRFRAEPDADVFVPLQADPNSTNQGHFLAVAGHLASGTTIESARAELKLLGNDFRRANPKWMSDNEQVGVYAMRDIAVREVRPALLILLGAVGLVLLMACANVANLLLARAASRQREVAIRAAVGAGRGQIVRQLLVESLLLSAVGAVAGVVAGVWGARTLVAMSPGSLPRVEDLANAPLFSSLLDWRVLAFAIAASLVTGVLFGLAPALHLARANPGATLKDAGGRGATGRHAARTRGLLVVLEMALALVLLVGATLLIRTFAELRDVRPGFESHNVLTFKTSLAGSRYATARGVDQLVATATERIHALPGVDAAAMAISLPTEGSVDLPFRIEGRAYEGDAQYHGDENWRSASADYFRALSIPLLRGRVFDRRDGPGATPVVVINAAMALKFWKDGDPLHQRITIGKGLGPEFEDGTRDIIGVVADVRDNGIDQGPPPIMYVPVGQLSDRLTRLLNSVIPASWIVLTNGRPAALAAQVEKVFLAVDGQLAVSQIKTMEQVVSPSIARQNFNMLLLTIFGGIALLLAAIGIYGLMSYSVEQATHDIGVRLALGADRRDILSMVVARGMKLAAIGVVLGLAAAVAASRVLATMLYGVRPTDPPTYVAVALALALIAFIACYVPARRAMRVDPLVALRAE